jgi:hypothetical protein
MFEVLPYFVFDPREKALEICNEIYIGIIHAFQAFNQLLTGSLTERPEVPAE